MGLKESGLRASVRSVSTVVPAFFDVAITDTNSPVNEGDVLVVDYSVDNTGDSFETQDIRLEIESVQEDADLDVSLSGGASDSGTLEWDTTGQDADTYEATVLSDDDSDTVTVEIPDAFFDVAIQSTNSPVEEGETLNVDYLVDNTGGVEDTQDIRLEIDNTQEDVDTDVTLDSDTSTTGTLQWDTTDESADTYSATVLSDDDSDSVTVEIESGVPDSAIHRWKLDDVNSTVSDSIGSVSGSVQGVSSVSGDWQGGSAGEGDGTDDEIILTDLSDFDSDLTDPPFSIAFTVETTDGDAVGFFGFEDPSRWKITSGDIGPEGGIDIVTRGDDDEGEQSRTADGGLIDDGDPHRVVCVIPEVDANNFEVYVDTDSRSMDVRRDNSSASSFVDGEVALFSENGSAHLDGIMDDVIIYDEVIGQSDVDSDYDLQPWS